MQANGQRQFKQFLLFSEPTQIKIKAESKQNLNYFSKSRTKIATFENSPHTVCV